MAMNPEQLLKDILAKESGADWSELEGILRMISSDSEMNRHMSLEWRSASRKTQESVCRYYAESKTWLMQTYRHGYGGLHALARKDRCELPLWAKAFRSLMMGPGLSILDYGGGFMKDTWFFPSQHVRVALAEIEGPVSRTVQAFIAAIGEPGVSVLPISGDTTDLGIHDGAVCFEVLEHMVDPVGMLRRIVASVRPSGPVALSVSFGAPEHAPYHIADNAYLSNQDTWKKELDRVGLELVWSCPSNGVWRKKS